MEKIIKRLGDRLQSSPKPVVENIVAGIVHEHVQVSERCDRRLEGGLGLHFIGNIQRDNTNFSEYLSSSSTSCSGLPAVTTTRSPASSTASVNALPKPREAPVMSHTFDINPLSAVHRKPAVRDPEPCNLSLMHQSA